MIESLDAGADADADLLWRDEIQKRMADLDSGRVQPLAWEDVAARLRSRIR